MIFKKNSILLVVALLVVEMLVCNKVSATGDEPTKTDVEPAKVEPAKTDVEPVKVEPAKTDVEPVKVEPAKDQIKTEAAKVEPAKTDVEPVKVEPAKTDVEPVKVEPAKTQADAEAKAKKEAERKRKNQQLLFKVGSESFSNELGKPRDFNVIIPSGSDGEKVLDDLIRLRQQRGN